MIKENKIDVSCEDVITPKAFVKASKAIADVPSYDWTTQRSSIMAYGTWRETFRNPSTWESD